MSKKNLIELEKKKNIVEYKNILFYDVKGKTIRINRKKIRRKKSIA